MEWLKQQPELGTESETGNASVLTRPETIKANHVQLHETYGTFFPKFFVSQFSGLVGIASAIYKPSLSIMYPGTDNPPLILSTDDEYRSALFVTISGEEYLAAASRDSIHLWNLVENTSTVVYKFKEQKVWLLCLIDERTVGCVAQHTSSDGFINIYILIANAEMWTLSSTHSVKVNNGASDVTVIKTVDGTSCLLLIDSADTFVQCIEMVGGEVRWLVDKQKLGEKLIPWSISSEGSIVFVVDLVAKLHLLSVEDGTVLTSVNLLPFGIHLYTCVQARGDHVYIGHEDEKRDAYCISKFSKPANI